MPPAHEDLASTSRAARGHMHIGEVAERTGLSLRTVRYYEEVGLLPEPDRSAGGFRLYTDVAVERLLVIKQMKPLEFTLEEMRELLGALAEMHAGPSGQRHQELIGVLVGYQTLVATRTEKMRERLIDAKALQDSLDELLFG